ncbi:MAG: hypothetical protein ACOYOK_04430 [Pseudobdellovibrionaceae bacterium]
MITIACGVLFSKTLLLFNFSQPMIRYGLAVAVSYLVFFFLIYIWLRWHFGARNKPQTSDSFDIPDLTDAPMNIDLPEPRWAGGGGQFSGGGASSKWEDGEPAIVSPDKSAMAKVASLGDLDEGVVIVLLIAVIIAVSGSAFYVVYQAPEILFEAAFEVFLVADLFRQGKKIQAEGWTYSIFKRTWLPFSVVLLIALTFGFAIKNQCPAATSFGEYRNLCWGHNKN